MTTKSLQERRKQLAEALPNPEFLLRASLFVRWRRCGKPNCHCARGNGHRTVYLTTTLRNGKTEQVSLPSDLVSIARRWVKAYQVWWKTIDRISAINRKLLRQRQVGSTRRQS